VREPVERPLILCEKASSAHSAVGGDPWRPQLQAEAIQPLSIGIENVSVSDKGVIRPGATAPFLNAGRQAGTYVPTCVPHRGFRAILP